MHECGCLGVYCMCISTFTQPLFLHTQEPRAQLLDEQTLLTWPPLQLCAKQQPRKEVKLAVL